MKEVEKRFSLSLKKWGEKVIKDFSTELEKELVSDEKSWKKTLEHALSYKMPPFENPKKRTKDRWRKFPYMRTGELRDSIKADVDKYQYGNKIILRLTANIKSPHGVLSNITGDDGAWVGWMDDILFGNGRENVKSLKDLFEELKGIRSSL